MVTTAIYRFRLTGGQGIGRSELLRLWGGACGSSAVSVSRVSTARQGEPGHTYFLWGAVRMRAPAVERRLRAGLTSALPRATFVLSHCSFSGGDPCADRVRNRTEPAHVSEP